MFSILPVSDYKLICYSISSYKYMNGASSLVFVGVWEQLISQK